MSTFCIDLVVYLTEYLGKIDQSLQTGLSLALVPCLNDPRGTHFQFVPLGSYDRVFQGVMIYTTSLTSIEFLEPNAPTESDPNYSPLKKLKRLEKNSPSKIKTNNI